MPDHLNTVRDVVEYVSGSTSVANHITYYSFGDIAAQSDSGIVLVSYYTGRFQDFATGNRYHRERWTRPSIRIWMSEDPISFQAGDVNLCRYVGNGPAAFSDPSGLKCFDGEPATRARLYKQVWAWAERFRIWQINPEWKGHAWYSPFVSKWRRASLLLKRNQDYLVAKHVRQETILEVNLISTSGDDATITVPIVTEYDEWGRLDGATLYSVKSSKVTLEGVTCIKNFYIAQECVEYERCGDGRISNMPTRTYIKEIKNVKGSVDVDGFGNIFCDIGRPRELELLIQAARTNVCESGDPGKLPNGAVPATEPLPHGLPNIADAESYEEDQSTVTPDSPYYPGF